MSMSHLMPTVFANPVPRGCGERSAGGVYVESGLGPGGRPLEDFLFDPPLPVPEGLDLVNKPQIWDDPVTGVPHLWVWVGAEYYPYLPDYLEETRRFGASRKLNPNLDLSRLVPASRLMLAHPFALNAAWLDQRPPYRCGKLLRGHALVRDEASLDDAGDDREHWGYGEAPSDDWRLPDEPVGPCLFKTYELIPTTAATEPDHPLVMEGRSWYSRVIGSTSYLYAPTGESPEGLQPGVFVSLTITGFALITRADGSVHEGAERKLAAAELPYYVSEQ